MNERTRNHDLLDALQYAAFSRMRPRISHGEENTEFGVP